MAEIKKKEAKNNGYRPSVMEVDEKTADGGRVMRTTYYFCTLDVRSSSTRILKYKKIVKGAARAA